MLERALYPTDHIASRLLRLLLAQDGSTTRLCEIVSGQSVALSVHHQISTDHAPTIVNALLGDGPHLERISSLHAQNHVLMDNLSYARLENLPKKARRELQEQHLPVGKVIERLCLKRERIQTDADALAALLFKVVGLPDPAASRAYTIASSDGPFMLIFETYRAGFAQAFKNPING